MTHPELGSENVEVGKLGELLGRWSTSPVAPITVCLIPPGSIPIVDEIPPDDSGWRVWLVGLGVPKQSYPTLTEAVQASLDEWAQDGELLD
jgi:hypothetical protein